jgi:hypothetical protein
MGVVQALFPPGQGLQTAVHHHSGPEERPWTVIRTGREVVMGILAPGDVFAMRS